MKKPDLTILLVLIVSLFSCPRDIARASSSQGPESLATTAAAVIKESTLSAHIQFLASDLLEGRATGTRGYDVAALYVAAQFEQIGLLPVDNSYFQKVPLRKADLVQESPAFTITGPKGVVQLKYAEQFLMGPDYAREETSVSADAVFAGFGVTAPDLSYDDYEGLDVKGKIIVLLTGAPASFPISERAHYSSSYTKEITAVNHGAVGIITVRNPQDEDRSPWERNVRQSKLSGYRWIDSQGTPSNFHSEIRGGAALSRAGAEVLFLQSGTSLEKIYEQWRNAKVKGFPLNVKVNLSKTSRFEARTGSNIVGMLKGSDPELKQEYVVHTAHLDHVGITDPVNGDAINNGAYDNATGIACLIETARAFKSLPQPPRRSVLFVAVTAEEKGLQGSDYFAGNPLVPLQSIVANVNTDMFLMLYPFTDAVALGADHSSLGPIAEKAFEYVGLKMVPDPAPEEVRFVRSDQYSFIKKGIPAIKLMAGFTSADASINGEEATRNWLKTIYHSPQDDLTQAMHWESGAKIVRANFLIGFEAANRQERPSWNRDDFFGKMFGGNASR